MVPNFNKRAYCLDALRGVCCLLVIVYHWQLGPIPDPIKCTFYIGVDVFFVLSGYLVGGSLIQEAARGAGAECGRPHLDVHRFLVKLSLRIYPLHYIYIVILVISKCLWLGPAGVTRQQVFGEMFYLQNFVGNLLGHTWTLAVEEHFYMILPLALLASGRHFPRLCAAVVCIVSFSRTLQALVWGFSESGRVTTHYFETYFRIDALFIGALLGWHKHYSPAAFEATQRRHVARFACGTLSLMASAALTGLEPVFSRPIVGYLMNALSSALIVASLAEVHPERESVAFYMLYPLSFIGFYSYAVYLFHNAWVIAVSYAVREHQLLGPGSGLVLCIAIAALTGWFMSELIDPLCLRARRHLLNEASGGCWTAHVNERAECPRRVSI